LSFDIVLSTESEEFIGKCDNAVRNRIFKSFNNVENEPENGKLLTLILKGLWILIVGDYSTIY
jgi:hypothetical protein